MQEVKSIVMIDDDADDLYIFKDACSVVDSSIQVDHFSDGEEALMEIPRRSFLPDLIFLDLNMPRFNGIEVLSRLKQNPLLALIPVIIYSTSFDQKVVGMCSDLGALQVIEKPNNFNLLCQTLISIIKN
jgi:CheY-like chemotaxis protein